MRGILAVLLALGVVAAAGPPRAQPAEPRPFADWAAVVVAADWRGSDGRPIAAFENARRDLTAGFAAAGFAPDRTASLSLAPGEAGAPRPLDTFRAIEAVTAGASGCLLYFTSHGSPAGIVYGGSASISPDAMDALVDRWCGTRPTVVVVSACFSGVFVPKLAAPNRMVLTAARRDRSSFGCGADATYPYFDGCVLEALPEAGDFLALAARVRACVARREQAEGLRPASEPQLYVGGEMQVLLPFLRLGPVSRAATP